MICRPGTLFDEVHYRNYPGGRMPQVGQPCNIYSLTLLTSSCEKERRQIHFPTSCVLPQILQRGEKNSSEKIQHNPKPQNFVQLSLWTLIRRMAEMRHSSTHSQSFLTSAIDEVNGQLHAPAHYRTQPV